MGNHKMVTIYDKMFLENENNKKYEQLIYLQKNIIENAIYAWRNEYNNDQYHWESFSLVDMREDEKDEVNKEIKNMVDSIMMTDYSFTTR